MCGKWRKFLLSGTLIAIIILFSGVSVRGAETTDEGSVNFGICDRLDGFTTDSQISQANYSSNKNEYHYIFHLGLAGPGLTAWDYATGKGVNVAVFDGGANVYHKDLASNVKGAYNAVTLKEGKGQVSDKNGHGTGAAGILAAVGNNKLLSAGVAYEANLYVVKVAADGSQSAYVKSVIEGIRYAEEKKCRVISISLSDTIYEKEIADEIERVANKKNNSILVVASGGNTGKKEYRYPASYENVLAVSGVKFVTSSKSYTSAGSTYNDRIDVAGPSNGLYTLSKDNNTDSKTMGATSAATPYVAGVAALVFQADPSLTAKECAGILTSTARDAGTKGYDTCYGYGIIDPLAAVQKAIYKKSSISRRITGLSSTYKKTASSKAFTLKPKFSGSGVLSYRSSKTSVAKVSGTGKVTIKGPGKTTIKVSVPKSGIYQAASKSVTLTVAPKKATISKLTAGTRSLKVTWKRDKTVTGYQVVIAKNKTFKKGRKSVTIKSNKTTSKVFKKLSRKKVYYVKARAYKTSGGTKLYGAYSKVKKIRVK
ncbi:S8 family serine peptidase [bacterium 210820-DFI.6.37]|nr:S8 family serine peptidase [bacterium 210820-DFI.6.37]